MAEAENWRVAGGTPRGHSGRRGHYCRHHRRRTNPIMKTTVGELDCGAVRTQRAGCILYTVHEGNLYFGLGVDAESHELTDFAGGVKRSDASVITAALREFREETLGILEEVSCEAISRCSVLYDSHNLVIFIHVALDPEEVCRCFRWRYERWQQGRGKRRSERPEVCGIVWLTWEEMQRALGVEDLFYSRVQRFLSRCGDFRGIL